MTEKNKATDSPLDSATIAKLHQALGENINIVLSHFIDYAPTQIDALSTAVAEADMEFLARKSHQMKGECYQIGALYLADLCREMENYISNNNQRTSQEDCLARISVEMDSVLNALSAEMLE